MHDIRALCLYYLFLILLLPCETAAFKPQAITPYPVLGYQEIQFVDADHSARQILVWYPVGASTTGRPSGNPWDLFDVAVSAHYAKSDDKTPLIVISHGYLGNPHQLSWLIRGLVHEGYTVAAIHHLDLVEGRLHADHWKRARDITTFLNAFFANPLSQNVNRDKIGVAGYSLGGTTSIWLAGGRTNRLDSLVPGPEFANPREFSRADEALQTLDKEMMSRNWRDPRIKAAFIMAPAWSWLFDEESLHSISIPVYLIAAEADDVIVTKNNADFFARHIPKSYDSHIAGKAGHYIFISALNERQTRSAMPSDTFSFLLKDDATVDRSWIQMQAVEECVRFFNSVFAQGY